MNPILSALPTTVFEVMSQLTDKCLEFVLTALWDDDDVPVAGSSGWP